MIHLDTSLLVDLLCEMARERPAAAFDAIESLDDDETLAVSVHVVCELRAGAELSVARCGNTRYSIVNSEVSW